MNVALVTLARYFHLHIEASQRIITLYLLVAAIVLIPSGRMADLQSRRDVYLLGVFFFFFGSAVAGSAIHIDTLLLGRALQGLGYGMSMALVTVLATSPFPSNEKGRALGVLALLSCLGLAVGPTLGGAIAQFLSWRLIFWMNLPLCCFSFLMVLLIFPRDSAAEQAAQERFGWGLVQSLFRNQAFLILVINRFLFLASYGIMLLIIPMYLQNYKNLPPLETGLSMLAMTLAVVIGSMGFARAVDHQGYRIFHWSACALFLLGYLFFIGLFYFAWLPLLFVGLICAGLATGLYFVGGIRGALHELPPAHQGLGMAFFYASSLLGGALCVAFAAQILHVNTVLELQSWVLKIPVLQQFSPAQLRAVGSGIQAFSAQNWGGSVPPLLQPLLLDWFRRGLLMIGLMCVGFMGLATFLAGRIPDDP